MKGNCCNKPTDEEIRKEVEDFYNKVEAGEFQAEISPDEVTHSLGYDKDLLDKLPEGVNLGLSC